jgi:lipopolysaccharide/colanic/teichoic acid biosynthesis glycosyltransferase
MITNEYADFASNTQLIENDYVEDGMSYAGNQMKRVFDFFVAAICLIVFSPLFLICSILVKREDGGPVIYKQIRIGLNGKPFVIYKFRSMKVDAEKDGPQLTAHENDDRMTKTGRFLRDHHLDELPQLYNVFKGDMSFVGPRPERRYFINKIMEHDPRYQYLFQIRPGVTSYATLYNGYTDTMDKMLRRLELDLYYLEHRSWLLDIKILAMTFFRIAFGKKF